MDKMNKMKLHPRMLRGWLFAAAGIISLLALAGCTRGAVELKNTVAAYNKTIVEAMAKPDAGVMEFFTTADERKRVESYIDYLRTEKKIVVNSLKKLDFRGVEVDKEKKIATVQTYEEWTYHYIDEKSRQPVTKEEAICYNNVYYLVYELGHWVVDKVDVNETQQARP